MLCVSFFYLFIFFKGSGKAVICLVVSSSVSGNYLEQQDPFSLRQIGNRWHVERFQAGPLAPSSEERGEMHFPWPRLAGAGCFIGVVFDKAQV